MRSSYLPVKFAFVVSLSLAVSSSSPSFLSFSSIKPTKTPSSPKTASSDLLSLLGSLEQAARINRQEAESFRSCLRFLVPFSPEKSEKSPLRGLEPTNGRRRLTYADEDALVWWPPEPVMELARLAVDSGGDPDAIYRAIDPTMLTVPDVDGCKKDRCTLTRTPYGRFHAKEYPAYDKEVFPINMGYCQTGVLVVLDAKPEGIIYKTLVSEYVEFVRTIYEGMLLPGTKYSFVEGYARNGLARRQWNDGMPHGVYPGTGAISTSTLWPHCYHILASTIEADKTGKAAEVSLHSLVRLGLPDFSKTPEKP
ncbi:hypothetical protein ACLOJK_026202 [Asimina triloba]